MLKLNPIMASTFDRAYVQSATQGKITPELFTPEHTNQGTTLGWKWWLVVGSGLALGAWFKVK